MYPATYNTAAVLAHLQSGNVGVDVFGDSLIAGQPSASGQGWDNLYYGLLRTWNKTPIRAFSVDIWRDAIQYTPSIDHSGAVTYPVGAHVQKKPNSDNAWTTAGADEIGVLGMCNGLEVAGQTSSGNQNLVDVAWTFSVDDFSALALNSVLRSTSASASIIAHHHADGMQFHMQLLGSNGTVAATVNTGSGSGITKSTVSGTVDLSSGTFSTIRIRQRSGAEGDQSGNYARIGQIVLEDTGTTGVSFTGCGIGGATIRDITNELGDTPAGLCDDAALSAYQTATGATTAFIMVGQNDAGAAEATLKAYYDALFARYAAAGYTYILAIGNYKNSVTSDANINTLNQAMYDAVADHATATAGFVSLYDQQTAAVHSTQAEADALANALGTALTASTTRTRTFPLTNALTNQLTHPLTS